MMGIDQISSARPTQLALERVQEKVIQPKEKQPNANILQKETEVEVSQNSKEEIKKMIDGLNKFLEPSHTYLKFQLHEKLNEYYVAIVNSDTKQVVREIPPKKLLDMYAFMLESIGLIVDHRI